MANEFKVKNGIKFPDGTVQTTASTGGSQVYPSNTGIVRYSSTTGTWGMSLDEPEGSLVGTSGPQTLSNKTIAYGSNNLTGVQPTLVSGTNIKTVNGQSVLGSGDLTISGGGASSSYTISNKTSAYAVTSNDLGSIINCTSGSFTVSLPSTSTLPVGFNVWVWNTSVLYSDVITVAATGSSNISGATTLSLKPGEGAELVCTGVHWNTGAKKNMRGYSENITNASITTPSATGKYSIAVGTSSNASGENSFAAMINNTQNGASGLNSIAMGFSSSASGVSAVSIGNTNSTSANHAVCIGGAYNTASGSYSAVLGGSSCTASGEFSTAGGTGASALQIGKWSYSAGDAVQSGLLTIRAYTTNTTPTKLRSAAWAAGADNQLILPNNSSFTFSGLITARQKSSEGTEAAAWRVEGLIIRGSSASLTSLVNSNITIISNSPGWSVAVLADTTNGGLSIQVIGAVSKNIYWGASLQTIELTYA